MEISGICTFRFMNFRVYELSGIWIFGIINFRDYEFSGLSAIRAIPHIFFKSMNSFTEGLADDNHGLIFNVKTSSSMSRWFQPSKKSPSTRKRYGTHDMHVSYTSHHPWGKFLQQAFLEIEGHFETWPHEKVQSDRSTRFWANPENRPLLPECTTPPGIMRFRPIGGVFWTPRADISFSLTSWIFFYPLLSPKWCFWGFYIIVFCEHLRDPLANGYFSTDLNKTDAIRKVIKFTPMYFLVFF